MISQLMYKKQNLQAFEFKQTSFDPIHDDDEEEKYVDIKEESYEEIEIKVEPEDDITNVNNEDVNKINISDITPIEIKEEDEEVKPEINEPHTSNNVTSWYHAQFEPIKKEKAPLTKYNPFTRNPLYGGGEFSTYLELIDLKKHFHPTVALYASNIINKQTIKYSGDPLNDFTLIRFLDRFVFKNPKKVEEKDGIHPTLARRKLYKPKGIKLVPVFSEGYVKEKAENIPVDELFLHS